MTRVLPMNAEAAHQAFGRLTSAGLVAEIRCERHELGLEQSRETFVTVDYEVVVYGGISERAKEALDSLAQPYRLHDEAEAVIA